MTEPALGTGHGRLAGVLAFGLGLVLLVIGRPQLFTENLLPRVVTKPYRTGTVRAGNG